jgi:predicted RNA-binding protein with TRAM domain
MMMLEIPDKLKSLHTSEVVEINGGYYVQIPDSEVEYGSVKEGEQYQCAVIERDEDSGVSENSITRNQDPSGQDRSTGRSRNTHQQYEEGPPVEEGDKLQVEIESTGDEGDGVARVDRGYVIMVEDAKPGDNPLVEVKSVKENVAFASVLEYNTHAQQ